MASASTHKSDEPRSDKTRGALIDAGIALFGEYGFRATTTRMLADHAGANIAAIPYHFGNKEGLYRAVIAHIAERCAQLMQHARETMESGLAHDPTPPHAIALLEEFIANMADTLIATEEPQAWVQLIMREQAKPTDAFDMLYDTMMHPMQQLFTHAFACATGIASDSEAAALHCHALFGQVLVFVVSRESILRPLHIRHFTAEHMQQIHRVLRLHIRACLQGVSHA
jgi:AcrR family transcriptional regulator